MGKIHELGFELANMIAAGEVVSRPASAIKELCENSIDAGATRITVEIQNGGVLLMRVADNGCGMDPEDLVLCVKRHATSKIHSAKDIDAITTMGFRGEALAALSAVTEMRIISKTENADCGHILTVEYGNITDISERAAGKGTTVIAENLFMNMPARRKFLKRDTAEASAVIDCVEKLALSHPEIAFCVISDGSIRFESNGSGKLEDVIYKVYGKDNARNLLRINERHEGVSIRGFIGSPMIHKVNRAYQAFFVNKRCVSSPLLSSCVTSAFTSYIPPDRFPLAVIFIDVNPLLLDVNVHPTKQEVKFANESTVYASLFYACMNALRNMEKMPNLSGSKFKGGSPDGYNAPKQTLSEAPAPLAVNRDESGREVTSSLGKNQMSFSFGDSGKSTDSTSAVERKKNVEYVEFEPGIVIPKPKTELMSPSADKYASTPEDVAMDTSVKKDPSTPIRYYYDSETRSYKVKEPVSRPDEPIYNTFDDPADPISERIPPSDAEMMPPAEEKRQKEDIPLQNIPKEILEPRAPLPKELFKYPPIAPGNTPSFEVRNGEHGSGVYAMYENGRNSYHRVIGEIFNKYILVEVVTRLGAKNMLVIDKHAAHERMIFEEMKESLERAERTSQLMAIPIEAEVGSALVNRIKRYKDKIENVGFRIQTGEKKVSIWSLPAGVDTDDAEEMLLQVLYAIEGGVKNGKSLPEIFDRSLFTIACKAAVKGGRECESITVDAIARAVVTDPKIRFCPHGRPVVYEVTLGQLDAAFKR